MITTDIKVSDNFKNKTYKAILSIIFFAIIYILLLTLAVGLTVLCIYGSVLIVLTFPRFVTLAFGIGLASFGILILIFLIKFIFTSRKTDNSHLHEIKREDEPELFNEIDKLVIEIGTTFPKKVFLSSEVNAAVFYDSTFLSMFFPIRKNLEIGLGLVNSVTKAELLAILSHEFGHFSQKSMKVGSHVYNVNKVIYNMLFDNESYDNMIQSWANISGYFSIFVAIAIKVIQSIQWVLRKMYYFVNINYMGLSREMEFHADEIAANVIGFEPLKSSLLRMSFADYCYNSVLSFYENKISQNEISENIFREHTFAMNFLAEENRMPIINGLPDFSVEEFNKFNKSKLVIKDQWASHPSINERIEKLELINLSSRNPEQSSANLLFKNIEKTQEQLTKKLFAGVKYQEDVSIIPFDIFAIEYKNDYYKNSFPNLFNCYYDNYNPAKFETNSIISIDENLTIEELFSDQKVDLVYTSFALKNDIETLKKIDTGELEVKTFDYDGVKYKQNECENLLISLNKQLEKLNEQIKQNDINIFRFFKYREQILSKQEEIEKYYNEFFDFDKEFDIQSELLTKLTNELSFVNKETPFEQISINFRKVEDIETHFKIGIKNVLSDNKFSEEITTEIKENLESYISNKRIYFINESYIDDNLFILFTAINNYGTLITKKYSTLKKNLLDYQVSLIN